MSVECIRRVVGLFGQIERVIRVNFIGCIRGVRGLCGHINRVIRVYFGNPIEPAEDPEKALEQSIIDMQEELVQMRESVATASGTQKRIERQYHQVQSGVQTWQPWEYSVSKQITEKQSLQILQINFLRGRRNEQLSLEDRQEAYPTKNSAFATVKCPPENSAQKASIPQQINTERRRILKAQLDQQTALIEKLKRDLILQESKILVAKSKKNLLKEQVVAEKPNEQLQNTIGCLDYSSVNDAFQLIEENVLRMEASVKDREMLMHFLEAPWETLIRRLEEALAAETIQRIEARSRSRLQTVAVLIDWKDKLASWKSHFLYRLILDRQEDLSQLRQLVDRAVIDRVIKAIAAQKRNELQYRQVQRVTIRWHSRAHEAIQKENENWARECLIRKNSFIKIAIALKAKLDEQMPLGDDLRQKLNEWENTISSDKHSPSGDELKQKLKELENKIAEFGTFYRGIIDSLKIQTPEYSMRAEEFSLWRFLKLVFKSLSFVSALLPTQVNQHQDCCLRGTAKGDRYSLYINERKFKVWLETLNFHRCLEYLSHILSFAKTSAPSQVPASSHYNSLNINFLADRFPS